MDSVIENMQQLQMHDDELENEVMNHVENEVMNHVENEVMENMESLQLSRYLYRKDEIELMIIQHLASVYKCDSNTLEDNSISEYHSMDMTELKNEIIHMEKTIHDNADTFDGNVVHDPMLFWISEYVESYHFDEIWDFLWKLYYDFYAVHFPELYNMMVSCYKHVYHLKNLQPTIYVEEQFISHLMRVVIQVLKTMQANVMDPKVFYVRMKYNAYIKAIKNEGWTTSHTIYRGRKADVIKPYSKAVQNMLLSIKHHSLNDILYYLFALPPEELAIVAKLTSDALDLEDPKLSISYEELIQSCKYTNHHHITMHYIVMVLHYIVAQVEKSKNLQFIKKEPTIPIVQHTMNFRNLSIPTDVVLSYIWNKFPIHSHVHAFHTSSDNYTSIQNEYAHCWQWHCKTSMIWQYRKNMSLNYPCGTHYALNPGGQSQDALSSIVYYNNQKREQEDVDGCPEHISDWCEIYLGVTWDLKEKCVY